MLMRLPIPSALRRPVLYPDHYAWYVLVSALDIMLTVMLLVHLGAREVNMIAQRSIELFGTWGLIGLKFASVLVVIAICEYLGRRVGRQRLGGRLALAAIFISLFPVAAAAAQVVFVLALGELAWIDWPPDPAQFELDPFIPPGLM
jgi:uncharacterized membrane protein